MDCSSLASCSHAISQARILQWAAISFSKGPSLPRDGTHIAGEFFTADPPGKSAIAWLQFSSVQFSCSVVSDSSRPHGLQHTRLPCPSPTPGACSHSCPLSQWCHPTISSSVVSFSSCLQSFTASGSFQMTWLFALGRQILEFQLHHQSFQWVFRTDFL